MLTQLDQLKPALNITTKAIQTERPLLLCLRLKLIYLALNAFGFFEP